MKDNQTSAQHNYDIFLKQKQVAEQKIKDNEEMRRQLIILKNKIINE